MTFMHVRRAFRIVSLTVTVTPLHKPRQLETCAAIVLHMASVVSGMAMRLVMMKNTGKVPNLSHTTGKVVIWHDMERADAFQIFFMTSFFPPEPNHRAIPGYM